MTPTVSRRRVLQGLGMLGLGGVTHGARAQDPVDPPPSSDQGQLPPLPGTVGRSGTVNVTVLVKFVMTRFEASRNSTVAVCRPGGN